MGAHSGPDIVEDGLVLCLDAANERSYPGSGTTWYDLSERKTTATKFGSSSPTYPLYKSDFSGYFEFIGGPIGDIKSAFFVEIPQLTQVTVFAIWRARLSDRTVLRMSNSDFQIGFDGFTAGDNFNDINVLRTNAIFGNNEWEIGSLTFNGSTLKAYKNGIFLAEKTRSSSTVISPGTLRIGTAASNGFSNFEGDISIIMIYNRALTESEIKQNFEATRSRYGI